jgi:hypothetical protein
MKVLITCWLSCLFGLLPAVASACSICRPKVQAAIHNADYSVNVLMLLLPLALLLAVGVGLYYADAIWARVQPSSSPALVSNPLAAPVWQ